MLTWDPPGGGGAQNIYLSIHDGNWNQIFYGPDWPNKLTGASTGVVIPANTLSAGQTYHISLNYAYWPLGSPSDYAGAWMSFGTWTATTFDLTPGTGGPTTQIVLKSDANTVAAALGWGAPLTAVFNQLDGGNTAGLNFTPALVGGYGTVTSVPGGAPAGTQIINVPPGDGENGFFMVTFDLPTGFTNPQLFGQAAMDDQTRVLFEWHSAHPVDDLPGSGYP